jgi:hypothetical protein
VIVIITSAQHQYTHKTVQAEGGADLRVISYAQLKGATEIPPATFIFTDVDRLGSPDRLRASEIFRSLRDRGLRVLNDPARMTSRFGTLRALHRAGINQFDVYRVEDLDEPKRWPVFLRIEGTHVEPVSDLLNDRDELRAAIDYNLARGVPVSALLIIEYAAEPVRPGLFRKLSAFRVGDRLLGYTCVHDDQWIVKYGKPGIAPPELYEEEYRFVAECPFADTLNRAFDLAGIQYGRVDYGLVDGTPQIYEINSNPNVDLSPTHGPIARRDESNALFKANYLSALADIDTPPPKGAKTRRPAPAEVKD